MPVSNPIKTVSSAALDCDGKTTVTISFAAVPQLSTVPADIVLILDRSGSMGGAPLDNAKIAAKLFIDIVAKASGNALGQTIENGSRMGLVSFADTAAEDQALTTDVAALGDAVNALSSGGFTNHKEAFQRAETMLTGSTATRQVVVMFTDGKTTVGGSADSTAEELKQRGVEIFCIGLGTDLVPLNLWATAPASTHVSSTNDVNQLRRVFAQTAAEVVRAGALDAVLRETLTDDFRIVRVLTPSHGTVDVLDPQTLDWTIGAAGAAGLETASLSFEIMHIGTGEGRKIVNKSVDYTDREGAQLTFPAPEVEVTCTGTTFYPEPCPLPVTFLVDSCEDAVVVDANHTFLSGLGRIIQVDAVIKHVCPGRRVAVALILTELDSAGVEHDRGVKTILIPAQTGTDCQNIHIKCVNFVVPEALDVTGSPHSICDPREFRVRVLANYVDTDFVCCDSQPVIM